MTAKQTSFPIAGNSRDADKFVVRLPDGLRELIQEIGKEQHRSMNSVIVTTLIKMVNDHGSEFVEQNLVVGDEAGWTPSIGMVVEIKPEQENKAAEVAVITGFEWGRDNVLVANLKGHRKPYEFKALRPHRVM